MPQFFGLRRAWCLLLLVFTPCLAGAAETAATSIVPPGISGARYPALSPDGRTVAFEYWGDIWVAPVDGSEEARRLTDHVAWDYLPRFSPDGSQIAFVSRRSGNDDIWVLHSGGGAARQVTTHSGTDILNGWLLDSSGVVFHSNRGLWSSDIYTVVVPREGRADTGIEEQVTAADHSACTFAQPLPDGGFIMSRGGGGRWWRKRYRGSSQNDLWRLWPAQPAVSGSGPLSQVTNFDGRDDWPMVSAGGHWVYSVCDQNGIDNIWAQNLITGARRQVTNHESDGVQWPSIQPGGDWMVYEFDGGLWIVDGGAFTASEMGLETVGNSGIDMEWNAKPLTIDISSETKDNWTRRVSFSDQAGEYAVSPNGKYVVFENGGDLWALREPGSYDKDAPPDQDLSRARRLTATDGVRERNPAFAPDNRHLAYSSDAGGSYDLHVLDLQDMTSTCLCGEPGDQLEAKYDPANADYVFAYSGNRQIRRFNVKDTTSNLVAEGNFRGGFGYSGYEVSPDGKWVAFVQEESDWNSEIYIIDSEGKNPPVNITRDPHSDSSPRWSPDGARLAWRSDRENDDSAWYAVELNPKQLPLFTDFLLVEEADKDLPEGDKPADSDNADKPEDDDADNDEDDGDKGTEKDKKEKKDKKIEVKINFDDIHYRARRLTRQLGVGTGLLSKDGRWLVYQADPDGLGTKVWAIRADPRPEGAKAEGWEPSKVLDSGWSQPQLTADGKRIHYIESAGGPRMRGAAPGGPLRYAKFSDGKVSGKENVASRGDFTLDRQARWQQMFREGWHVLGQRFYDPGMHGVDWQAAYDKYARYIDDIATPEEFELLFSELLGELNASHLGIGMTEMSYTGGGPATGHLGFEVSDGSVSLPWPAVGAEPGDLEVAATGRRGGTSSTPTGLTVTHITYRGPADQDGVDIEVGDTVLEIDGKPVAPGMRWYDLLADKAGLPVSVKLSRGGAEHETLIKATSWGAYQSLLYREWEKLNEDFVSELSGGRIGYIHIAAMSGGELAKFEREFFSEMLDKEALIVDVRFNGGGNIHEELFEHLHRAAFSWNVPRDSVWTMQPARAYLQPKALLINARSGSDAEIFPSGWRTLGLGPVIGVPTAGAVIGTGGFSLVDGSSVRLPMEGWYELSGRNLETESTPPDVLVEVDPNALRLGEDAQLRSAVELLLGLLAEVPARPAPPAAYPPAR